MRSAPSSPFWAFALIVLSTVLAAVTALPNAPNPVGHSYHVWLNGTTHWNEDGNDAENRPSNRVIASPVPSSRLVAETLVLSPTPSYAGATSRRNATSDEAPSKLSNRTLASSPSSSYPIPSSFSTKRSTDATTHWNATGNDALSRLSIKILASSVSKPRLISGWYSTTPSTGATIRWNGTGDDAFTHPLNRISTSLVSTSRLIPGSSSTIPSVDATMRWNTAGDAALSQPSSGSIASLVSGSLVITQTPAPSSTPSYADATTITASAHGRASVLLSSASSLLVTKGATSSRTQPEDESTVTIVATGYTVLLLPGPANVPSTTKQYASPTPWIQTKNATVYPSHNKIKQIAGISVGSIIGGGGLVFTIKKGVWMALEKAQKVHPDWSKTKVIDYLVRGSHSSDTSWSSESTDSEDYSESTDSSSDGLPALTEGEGHTLAQVEGFLLTEESLIPGSVFDPRAAEQVRSVVGADAWGSPFAPLTPPLLIDQPLPADLAPGNKEGKYSEVHTATGFKAGFEHKTRQLSETLDPKTATAAPQDANTATTTTVISGNTILILQPGATRGPLRLPAADQNTPWSVQRDAVSNSSVPGAVRGYVPPEDHTRLLAASIGAPLGAGTFIVSGAIYMALKEWVFHTTANKKADLAKAEAELLDKMTRLQKRIPLTITEGNEMAQIENFIMMRETYNPGGTYTHSEMDQIYNALGQDSMGFWKIPSVDELPDEAAYLAKYGVSAIFKSHGGLSRPPARPWPKRWGPAPPGLSTEETPKPPVMKGLPFRPDAAKKPPGPRPSPKRPKRPASPNGSDTDSHSDPDTPDRPKTTPKAPDCGADDNVSSAEGFDEDNRIEGPAPLEPTLSIPKSRKLVNWQTSLTSDFPPKEETNPRPNLMMNMTCQSSQTDQTDKSPIPTIQISGWFMHTGMEQTNLSLKPTAYTSRGSLPTEHTDVEHTDRSPTSTMSTLKWSWPTEWTKPSPTPLTHTSSQSLHALVEQTEVPPTSALLPPDTTMVIETMVTIVTVDAATPPRPRPPPPTHTPPRLQPLPLCGYEIVKNCCVYRYGHKEGLKDCFVGSVPHNHHMNPPCRRRGQKDCCNYRSGVAQHCH